MHIRAMSVVNRRSTTILPFSYFGLDMWIASVNSSADRGNTGYESISQTLSRKSFGDFPSNVTDTGMLIALVAILFRTPVQTIPALSLLRMVG